MGLFSALMGGNQQQPYGMTYPGAGQPMNTQIAQPVGAPQLPAAPAATAGARPGGMMPSPTMPAGASSTPNNGSGMFAGLANNPMLMQALAKGMTPNPATANGGAGVASGAAGIGPAGQFGGMSGADANTMRSQLQGGAPGTEMISPQFAAQMASGASGADSNSWLQQLLARFQGGGASS